MRFFSSMISDAVPAKMHDARRVTFPDGRTGIGWQPGDGGPGERWTRPDVGHLHLEMVVTDPSSTQRRFTINARGYWGSRATRFVNIPAPKTMWMRHTWGQDPVR
jgi:hypothetical protein